MNEFPGFDRSAFENISANHQAVGLGIFGIIIIMLIAVFVVKIFYLMTLSGAIKACSPESRKTSPGMVWIELIPIVGYVWAFVNVINVSGTLGNELRKSGISQEENPSMVLGIIAFALIVCGNALPFLSLAGLICWIIYWVKISGYTKQLLASGSGNYY